MGKPELPEADVERVRVGNLCLLLFICCVYEVFVNSGHSSSNNKRNLFYKLASHTEKTTAGCKFGNACALLD